VYRILHLIFLRFKYNRHRQQEITSRPISGLGYNIECILQIWLDGLLFPGCLCLLLVPIVFKLLPCTKLWFKKIKSLNQPITRLNYGDASHGCNFEVWINDNKRSEQPATCFKRYFVIISTNNITSRVKIFEIYICLFRVILISSTSLLMNVISDVIHVNRNSSLQVMLYSVCLLLPMYFVISIVSICQFVKLSENFNYC